MYKLYNKIEYSTLNFEAISLCYTLRHGWMSGCFEEPTYYTVCLYVSLSQEDKYHLCRAITVSPVVCIDRYKGVWDLGKDYRTVRG